MFSQLSRCSSKEDYFLRVVLQFKSSVSELESKLDSVMNLLSMTASPSGIDPQQIPGITISVASYAQITRSSMSLWKLETRYQIR